MLLFGIVEPWQPLVSPKDRQVVYTYLQYVAGSSAHLRRMIQGHVGFLCNFTDILLAFPDDARNASMCVQHVDRRVPLQVQHLIKVESAAETPWAIS